MSKRTKWLWVWMAGLMLTQLTKWLRGLPVEPDLSVNLLSSELTAMPAG